MLGGGGGGIDDRCCPNKVRVCAKLVVLHGQMYVGMSHMPDAKGFTCQASVRVATCHMCTREARAAREYVSVSSPSRVLGVVAVSHRLSLQRQLPCSFPPNFTPHPAMHHPPPLQYLCRCFSLPSPCPAQLPPEGEEVSHFGRLCPPAPCPFPLPLFT